MITEYYMCMTADVHFTDTLLATTLAQEYLNEIATNLLKTFSKLILLKKRQSYFN